MVIDIELPTDIMPKLYELYKVFVSYLPKIFNWIVEVSGGNPVVAGMLISFPIYLIIDFFNHSVLDKPAASMGSKLMKFALNSVIFIMLFVVMHSAWNQ